MASYFLNNSTDLKIPAAQYRVKAYKPHDDHEQDLGIITGNGLNTFTDIPEPAFSPPYLIVLQAL
jgi:hypothetical protein